MLNVQLLVIDPQNSFCKNVVPSAQQTLHSGELCVTPGGDGAMESMQNVANLVDRLGKKLTDIHVTLDSHHALHIAHGRWFKNTKGDQPAPFTLMREEGGSIIGYTMDAAGVCNDVGEFTTFVPSMLKHTLEYLKALATEQRYPHCIWPEHCLIGTRGHNIVEPLFKSLYQWEQNIKGFVNLVTKGSNPRVEHFSALRAEVPDPQDPTTQLNSIFINTMMEADVIVLAGQARSHCLANTVVDGANEFKDADDAFIKKCILLDDCTDDVPGFEFLGDKFVDDMVKRGMKVAKSTEYLV